MEQKSMRFKDPSQAAELETLKAVERYTIKNHLLGEGSFAKTYLTLRDKTQEILACKMIIKKNLLEKIKNSRNQSYTRDFLANAIRNEAKTWKELKHKNIVSFKDFAETENNVYFFLEYCADGNLDMLLKKRKLTEKESIKLFKQIVEGCDYLYDRGILHRDLKPENILIHEGYAKIADFGFAKLVEEDELKNNSMERTNVGTPIYMSPQVLLGQPYNIKCDVWSLGVIFYKVLFGMFPWQQSEKMESLIESIRAKIVFPAGIQVNPALRALIFEMLSYDERDRISIKQVKKLLQSIEPMETE